MHYGGLEPNEAGGVYAATYKYDAYADGISSRTYSAVCERSGRQNLVFLGCIPNIGSLHVHETLLKQHNTQYSGHMGKTNQNEVMVEICPKSLVRAIG